MSKIEVDEVVNQSGDNDSGIDLTTNDQIGFKIANASKWTLNSSGNLFPASTSQGIVLGATSDTSANRLDDYEEGTFIPEVTFATPPSGGRTAGKGQYTKIGRLVTVHLRVENIDTTGASGDIEITGFPFTSTSDSGDGAVTAYQGTCRASAVNYASSSYLIAEITDGNATARITEITDNSGADVINTGNISDGASDILATISYTTAS
tara:strand:- start:1718 stop:2341 length:624 start_codon:yes stop_codon:yes gene_type:complete